MEHEDFNQRVAARLRELRDERGLSIESLAQRSGVSRAMISRIERGESSPTAVLLNKLSIGLGVLLPSLFGSASSSYRLATAPKTVTTQRDQTEWQDPASGYSRRTLTPDPASHTLQLSEIRFPAGASVTFENAFGQKKIQQQIWILEGSMHVRLGHDAHQLKSGDCMVMTLDRPITFHNAGRKAARYLVAIAAMVPQA
jgi:transcriptional regulator with XRE-family HTH domain